MNPDAVEGGVCPVCGGTGWEEIEVDTADTYGEGTTGKAVRPCTACNGDHARNVKKVKKSADISENVKYSDFNWNVYNVNVRHQMQIVEKFIDRFPDFEKERLGLFISSKTRGSGKTFLASAVGAELIERYEASTRFVSVSELIDISKQKREDGTDAIDDLISCRVLILDDLGQKATGRDWLSDILFRIIDKRYQKGRIVIVTSNVELKELDFDDRIVDRLNAMTVLVKIPEYSVRAREANARKEAILQKLGIE